MSNLTQRRSHKKDIPSSATNQSHLKNSVNNSQSPFRVPMTPQQPSYDPRSSISKCSATMNEQRIKCEYMREALCTIVWAILACLLRGGMVLLFQLAHLKDVGTNTYLFFRLPLEIISGVLSFVTSWLPLQFEKEFAPGFLFVTPILMLNLRQHFGTMPSLPIKICEMMMGRVTPRELAILVPIHFLASVVGALALNILLPGIVATNALSPLIFSEDNFWITDFLREAFITAMFCIGMLVLPEMFRLNKFPIIICTTIIFIPVYLYSVDAEGMGSSFSPDLIYALRLLSRYEEVPLRQSSHLFGPMLGGALGGYIMSQYFPDNGFDHVNP